MVILTFMSFSSSPLQQDDPGKWKRLVRGKPQLPNPLLLIKLKLKLPILLLLVLLLISLININQVRKPTPYTFSIS